jgi:RNA polymerase sigma factor (sigma-70 family)
MVAQPETLPVDAAAEAAAATRALFEQHGRMVLSICRSLLRGAPEAEDAAQETFLAAHRSLLAGHGPRKPGAWLATIARNECLARLRNRPVLVEYSEGDGMVEHVDATQQAVIDELKAAIAELPPRQRETVVLREFYGLSPREIATAMELTTPVVDALLLRARRKLRRQLTTLRSSGSIALGFPQALREALERVIPGFEASAGAAVGGSAGVGLAAKVAVAAIGAVAVGTVGHEVRKPATVPITRPALVVARAAPARTQPGAVAVVRERKPVVRREVRRSHAAIDRSGPGSGERTTRVERDTSGPGGGSVETSSTHSGPGPAAAAGGSSDSGSSGTGSGSGSGAEAGAAGESSGPRTAEPEDSPVLSSASSSGSPPDSGSSGPGSAASDSSPSSGSSVSSSGSSGSSGPSGSSGSSGSSGPSGSSGSGSGGRSGQPVDTPSSSGRAPGSDD